MIQDSIDSVEASLALKKMESPSLRTPMSPESEPPRMQPEVGKVCICATIVTAAYQTIQSSALDTALGVVTPRAEATQIAI
ncbi:uncharacterized protein PHACADRAFT_198458 [Phanerochaete carnosa HHB-10118-sp]|uniref:Uncharacterized protein n=1 Tax=Phanerochaete carnosa (strain HHB-10118-sp) TaxID=650164 RepID=K5VLV8_PHACS|nr:uncharacterized protein PHACADRAFT_198458 [Phanerochaete carnosa HHB-10118-sp]EKM52403.1 hypothetical protein PHACADRAFT_198458 [Phanerochaete carnosa HHB-10118-sp]